MNHCPENAKEMIEQPYRVHILYLNDEPYLPVFLNLKNDYEYLRYLPDKHFSMVNRINRKINDVI